MPELPGDRNIQREREFTAVVRAWYRDPDTGARTEITFTRTKILARDVPGARTSALGLARSVTLAELLDDPDTGCAISAAPE